MTLFQMLINKTLEGDLRPLLLTVGVGCIWLIIDDLLESL